ncbi:hypothetical protein XELAEV_18025213mg [Xenopus laevis]|uniref:Uncharacterized protein n=1 Tax=Xenopus laevis TaxID=8355 RepID=A0A974HM50_XENLA|nr:hypothetical protein XELAEV_18025213mg [Xenopus laevis]
MMILESGMCVGSCRHYWPTLNAKLWDKKRQRITSSSFAPQADKPTLIFSSLLCTPTLNLNMFLQAALIYLYYIWMDFKQGLSLCLWSVTSARTPMASTEQ